MSDAFKKLAEESLGELKRKYASGCIPYWETKTPNLWAQEMDLLEESIQAEDASQLKGCVKNLLKFIDQYLVEGPLDLADLFEQR